MSMKVFVYGTLKLGYSNNVLLENSKLIGEAITLPEYTMYDLGAFPAVSEGGDTSIHGEVWEVDNLTFEDLDMLEGYPTFYDRSVIRTDAGEAWMYHINDMSRYNGSVVHSGKWER